MKLNINLTISDIFFPEVNTYIMKNLTSFQIIWEILCIRDAPYKT